MDRLTAFFLAVLYHDSEHPFCGVVLFFSTALE